MKKNPRLEERRKSIPTEIDKFVNESFEIVDRIHHILSQKNLDQKDLATLLGKQESEISKWMTGTHNFTLKTISRIETVLGCQIIKVLKNESLTKRPTFYIVTQEYAMLKSGKNIYIGESKESIEIEPKFQKTTTYLS